jgi:hypothetical protein
VIVFNYSPNHAIVKLREAGFSVEYVNTGGGCMCIAIPLEGTTDYLLVADSEGSFFGYANELQSDAFSVTRNSADGDWWTDELGNIDDYKGARFFPSPIDLSNLTTVVGNLAAMDIVWPAE